MMFLVRCIIKWGLVHKFIKTRWMNVRDQNRSFPIHPLTATSHFTPKLDQNTRRTRGSLCTLQNLCASVTKRGKWRQRRRAVDDDAQRVPFSPRYPTRSPESLNTSSISSTGIRKFLGHRWLYKNESLLIPLKEFTHFSVPHSEHTRSFLSFFLLLSRCLLPKNVLWFIAESAKRGQIYSDGRSASDFARCTFLATTTATTFFAALSSLTIHIPWNASYPFSLKNL